MTQDEIIEMARQAGLSVENPQYGYTERHHVAGWITDLEAFAKLVAAKEREKVAKWQIGSGYSTGHGETIEDLLVELEWQVRESEREACAKVCEQFDEEEGGPDSWDWHSKDYAQAIRARGQA